MLFNRAKRLFYNSLYDLYGLKIYDLRGTIYDLRFTILKLQGVPLLKSKIQRFQKINKN